jgi:hypothetical protein
MGVPKVSPFLTRRGLFIFLNASYLTGMDTFSNLSPTSYQAHWLDAKQFGQLLIVQTFGREAENIVELVTQWVLRGSFHLIAGGDWLPDYDDLQYAVFRYTNDYNAVLNRLRLVRARTCFQLLDLLVEADEQNKPVLILDFLYHFYNSDVNIEVRDRIMEACCSSTKRLSLSNPVAVLMPVLDTPDYKRFFPLLASVATEIIPAARTSANEISQERLF